MLDLETAQHFDSWQAFIRSPAQMQTIVILYVLYSIIYGPMSKYVCAQTGDLL